MTTMRTPRILAAIVGLSASALAQTVTPNTSGKLKQAKPEAPMGCKLANCQRDQALGRRLCGGVRTSWYHIPGRTHRAAYPRSKSPSCKTVELSVALGPPHTGR